MPLSEYFLSATQLGTGLILVQEMGDEEPRAYLYQLDIIPKKKQSRGFKVVSVPVRSNDAT